jgi:3-oxo-5-alpha-steroid 4-dehydrogenase 1
MLWVVEKMLELFESLIDFNNLNELTVHRYLCYFVLSTGVCSFIILNGFISAPYVRYSSSGFGPVMNAKLAWVLMESPNIFISAICCYLSWGSAPLQSTPNQILLFLFLLHYVNRALIYPLRMKSGNPVPFTIFLSAFVFCSINAYLQAQWLSKLETYESSWLQDIRFHVGVFIWLCGFYLNLQADDILRNLRKPGLNECITHHISTIRFTDDQNKSKCKFEHIRIYT